MRGLRMLVIVAAACATAAGAVTHPFHAGDLVSMSRVSDPQPSPDGSRVVFVVRSTDLEADRGRTDLWLTGLAGGEPRQLTTDPAGDSSPRWSPDGKMIYFLSSRSESSQVWAIAPDGGEARQVSDLPLDVGSLVVSPDGERLALTVEVFPDCAPGGDESVIACTARRLDERDASKRTGRAYDRIFVRHWDAWKDGRRSHLFVMPAVGGEARHLTPGLDADVPSKPFGGAEEIAFTPDGRGLVFAARVAGAAEPWSTDFDLWQVPVDGTAAPRCLTEANEAWDTGPVFSPDGETLAYLAMTRPGFEADRFRIVLRAGRKASRGCSPRGGTARRAASSSRPTAPRSTPPRATSVRSSCSPSMSPAAKRGRSSAGATCARWRWPPIAWSTAGTISRARSSSSRRRSTAATSVS